MSESKTENKNENTKKILGFIKESPSCFHAVKKIADEMKSCGFTELSEKEKWNLSAGGKYFVTRNSSSIISFAIPKNDFRSFRIVASHSDSPGFKVKENPELCGNGCTRLNVEKYGGMLLAPWFDRPLSVAGRVCMKSGNGFVVEERLFDFGRDIAMIPSLAIHFARDANDGHKINFQNEMMPIITTEKDFNLKKKIAEKISFDGNGKQSADEILPEILSYDLFVYNRDEGKFWGANDEFISSPRLDDLECAFSTMIGFAEAVKNENADGNSVLIHAVFDNEEVGSSSRQGANSTFLEDTLKRINLSLGKNDEDYMVAVANSFLVSADNAHALHPSFADKSDLINRPKVNGGIVIKFNASQKYTSDAVSSGMFKRICENANVPVQIFTNNSNVAGGSTLGNISTSHVSVLSVDIGLAQWAMHSPYESAGAADAESMVRAMSEFYRA